MPNPEIARLVDARNDATHELIAVLAEHYNKLPREVQDAYQQQQRANRAAFNALLNWREDV